MKFYIKQLNTNILDREIKELFLISIFRAYIIINIVVSDLKTLKNITISNREARGRLRLRRQDEKDIASLNTEVPREIFMQRERERERERERCHCRSLAAAITAMDV